MKTKIIICLAALLGVAAVDVAKKQFELPKAKLTVKVSDEQGNPVSGADVWLGFRDSGNHDDVALRGKTNPEGLFSGDGYSDSRVGGNINKDGYYQAGFAFKDFMEVKDGRWLPWDATYRSILRPIGKPVGLYARTFRKLEVPAVGQPCGFDLVASDWVSPWGKGTVSDFIIKVDERRYAGWDDFDAAVSISFANPHDGILEAQLPEVGRYSTFKWERSAPEIGYVPTFSTHVSWKPIEGYRSATSEKQNYFIRVRTVDQNGHIVSGLYGKIAKGILIEPRKTKTCSIAFTYYLNPTPNDRNLEWDTTKNLIPGLKPEETPREP